MFYATYQFAHGNVYEVLVDEVFIDNKHGLALGKLQFTKQPDNLAWQRWRLKSIVDGLYTAESFSRYRMSMFIKPTKFGSKVRSNRYLPKGEKWPCSIGHKGKKVSLEMNTLDCKILPMSEMFRFEYRNQQ